jgi:DNA-binding MarR family transcriptional regulator
MPPPRKPPTEATDALIGVAPLITRWMERLLAIQEQPLTLAQFLTLRAVAAGTTSGAELARSAGVSGPAVSQLITNLVDGGLIERTTSAGDRRRQELSLSTRGTQTLSASQAALRAELGSALAGLPHPEADALARALPHVEAVLAGVAPPRRPPPPRPPGPPHRGPLA